MYVAVIAVILSPEIKRDGQRDTSAERDTSPSKVKPSVRTRFISCLDVRLCLAVRSVTFSGSVTEVSLLPDQFFYGLEGKR